MTPSELAFGDHEAIGEYVNWLMGPLGFDELLIGDDGLDRYGTRWQRYDLNHRNTGRGYIFTVIDKDVMYFKRITSIENQLRQILNNEFDALLKDGIFS